MIVAAIDPGTRESALIVYDEGSIAHACVSQNETLLNVLAFGLTADHLLIEKVESYGMPVGADVFTTVFWAGRFAQAWNRSFDMVPRRLVKLQLCGSSRAKDSNVRQALIDRFAPTGGGKTPQIGTKARPGPLYWYRTAPVPEGVKRDHLWAALGVAVAWSEQRSESKWEVA